LLVGGFFLDILTALIYLQVISKEDLVISFLSNSNLNQIFVLNGTPHQGDGMTGALERG
jgi:hypothetical protein